MRARKLAILAAISASLLFAAVFSTPANAAAGDWFKSYAALSWCAQENGTSGGVFLDPCSTNSSDLWTTPATTTTTGISALTIRNVHSQLCLTGFSDGTVDLNPCNGSNAQAWTVGICNTANQFIYFNVGGSGFLWQSNKSLQLRSTQDTSSVHDCWAFFQPS